MPSPSASSSRSDSLVLIEPSSTSERVLNARQGTWAKRLITSVARRLKENGLFFPAIVRSFRSLQRLGIDLTPNHFYWPVPDVEELSRREWPIYATPPGCDFRLRDQIELARHFSKRYVSELDWDGHPAPASYHYNNGYFESCDAEVAYCMVRKWKPRRIIEIGSGFSTRAMAHALRVNREQDGVAGELITVDPCPERLPENALGDVVTVVVDQVQRMNVGVFEQLRADDILFIDSSHVVSVGSDVVREYLQILPRLKPGVLVHVHDIFLPSDYPRRAVLDNLWFWSEQYLLQAFLSFNTEFEVLWSASAMQLSHARVLEQCFPNWRNSYASIPSPKRRFIPTVDGSRVWPSSFWMRRLTH
ncbi:MAG: class I SAM-dependent methyltransferase [Terriglobales bacterium]